MRLLTLSTGIGLALFSLFGPSVLASSLNLRINPGPYFESCNRGGCISGDLPSANAKVISVPQDDGPAARERIHRWEVYCQPTAHVDNFGVTRFSYAHPGCEFGKSSD